MTRPLASSIHDLPEHMQKDAEAFKFLTANKTFTPLEQRVAWTLFAEFESVFGEADKPLSRTKSFEIKFKLIEGAQPVRFAPFRASPMEKQYVKEELDKMLQADIIRPSRSPWGARVLLVKKKDSTQRFCVDYRALNDLTVTEVYPLPRIDDALAAFQGKKIFSTMDMQSGYWQMAVAEEDKHKTSFVTHEGQYEFNVMPFGPKNAPGYFQRMMDTVLGSMKWLSVIVYIDDLIVFSTSFAEHIRDLGHVFMKLKEHGLTLKLKKCRFFADEVEYLGHIIAKDGIRPNPAKTQTIQNVQLDRRKKAIQAFLGLTGYYRRFVKNYAKTARPLYQMCKDNVDIKKEWGPNQDAALETLRMALVSHPVLCHPDWDRPFRVTCDASGEGLGACLTQSDDDGIERVIEWASRQLTPAERKWFPTEWEALACVWACEHFRPYLDNGRQFELVTDHRALLWLLHQNAPTGRLARWALRLQPFNYTVIHKKGSMNHTADFPSRFCLDPDSALGADHDEKHESRVDIFTRATKILSKKRKRDDSENIDSQEKEDSIPPKNKPEPQLDKRRLAMLLQADEYEKRVKPKLPSRNELVEEIQKDDSFKNIYTFLTTGYCPESEIDKYEQLRARYVVEDHMLFALTGLKKASQHNVQSYISEKFVIPDSLRAQLVLAHHEPVHCGHQGVVRTLER